MSEASRTIGIGHIGWIIAVTLLVTFFVRIYTCAPQTGPGPLLPPAVDVPVVPAATPLAGQANAVVPAVTPVDVQVEDRDSRWAVPMQAAGLPNLNRITDTLYRGAQPTEEGFRALKAMGVKTVVNLRSFHSDRDEMGALEDDFDYEHITMKAWHPEDKEVVRFLRIVTDPERRPVFFHCQHGADRTGVMCAVYRITQQGWTVDDAVEEMTQGGYGYHAIWKVTLEGYLRDLDFDEIMERVESGDED